MEGLGSGPWRKAGSFSRGQMQAASGLLLSAPGSCSVFRGIFPIQILPGITASLGITGF